MLPPLSHNTAPLVLRRTFTAPRQRVFRAWIEPAALERWLRPKGIPITVRTLDARVGGTFHFDLANGGTIVGTYLRIDPPEKLIFTWTGAAIQGQATTVTLDFLDQGAVTEVVLTHDGWNNPDLRALVATGWPAMLAALAEVLASDAR